MKKYGILLLMLLISACASSVEVEERVEYKCGQQVILTELLDDDSMIVKINGDNYVLDRVETSSGKRYDNVSAQISIWKKSGDVNLWIKEHQYPLCKEILR